MDLDQVDAERRGPFAVRVAGEKVVLPAATDLHWRIVMASLESPHYFATLVWPSDVKIEAWKIESAQLAWVRHQGLPPAAQAQRLVYTVERWYDGLEYDLQARLGLSLGDLFRERRWRELLGYIDQLPSDSHLNRLMANDEEYMEAVLSKSKETSGRPSMSDWSQTNSMLAVLIDAVNKNTATLVALNATKGPKPTMQPYPRPATVVEKLVNRHARQQHEEMKAILLRDRKTG